MNGRPNGIGGRAEGSGGRYGWLRCTCQLDLLCMCATTHASETKKKCAYLEPTPPGPAKSTNIGYINTCLLFVFIISPLPLVHTACYIMCFYTRRHASFIPCMHSCHATFQDPCAHLFQADLFQTTLLAGYRHQACQA